MESEMAIGILCTFIGHKVAKSTYVIIYFVLVSYAISLLIDGYFNC